MAAIYHHLRIHLRFSLGFGFCVWTSCCSHHCYLIIYHHLRVHLRACRYVCAGLCMCAWSRSCVLNKWMCARVNTTRARTHTHTTSMYMKEQEHVMAAKSSVNHKRAQISSTCHKCTHNQPNPCAHVCTRPYTSTHAYPLSTSWNCCL